MSSTVCTCTADDIFAVFSACQGDPDTLILDVRPSKEFSKRHIIHAFCVRVSANGNALLDYSQAAYDRQKWGDACWWDKQCIIYGHEGLRKDHPAVNYLSTDGHARRISIFRDGFNAFADAFPFLCTAGVRTQRDRIYPSKLDEGLYLGNWGHAVATDRLAELGVQAIVTIHNNPERLHPCPGVRHMQIQMADVDTEDIRPWFGPVYAFIDLARTRNVGVLVHCGAGVSRSAALCISYLMQKHGWSAQKSFEHVKARRSIVQPNDGFWRALCELEGQLAMIPVYSRSDPNAFSGVHGRDWNESLRPDEEDSNLPAKATFEPAEGIREWSGRDPARHDFRESDRRRSRSRDYGRRHHRRHIPPDSDADHHRQLVKRGGTENGMRLTSGASGSQGPVLEVYKGGVKFGVLSLDLNQTAQTCIFGRLPACAVVLEHPSASRHHAQLSVDDKGCYYITDMGSAHGTQLDGVWIRPNVARQLHIGSTLRFGASTREYKVADLPVHRSHRQL